METKSVTGVVLEVSRQDGSSDKGEWTKWGFNIQHEDTGEKHWYSWFNKEGANIRSGQAYTFTYTTSNNPNNADHPYRNINALMDSPVQQDDFSGYADKITSQDSQNGSESPVEAPPPNPAAVGACANHAMALIESGVWPVPEGRDVMSWYCECRDYVYWHGNQTPVMPRGWCYLHNVGRNQDSKQRWYHKYGEYYCMEAGIFDAEGEQVKII